MKQQTRILIDARELIADRELWGQGSMESDHDPDDIQEAFNG